MNSLVDQIQLERFCNLVSMYTGIIISAERRMVLRDYIISEQRIFSLSGMEAYCRILEQNSHESRLEWKKLITRITIGESYFFRDKGQFDLLEKTVLPELIELRKKERTLRIWSAGCSTGEEAYSLAILVDRLIPRQHSWKIFILGTDINEEAIKKAEKGFYGQWSFRKIEPDIKSRYFRKKNEQWEISGQIRNMAVFRTMNLVLDEFPDYGTGLYNMDLVLCRNLFIYFGRMAVCRVLKKLENTLGDGGCLITGHGELYDQEPDSLDTVIFPESVIYRKASRHEGCLGQGVQKGVVTHRNHDTAVHEKRPGSIGTDTTIPAVSDSGVRDDTNSMSGDISTAFFMARAYAARGLYDEALEQLNRLLRKDPVQIGAYLLLAQIVEIQGDHEGAKDSLKKAIYLDPASVVAHLELGAIYQKEGDTARATKLKTIALQLVKALPPDTIFEIYDGISARELENYVAKMLGDESDEMSILAGRY